MSDFVHPIAVNRNVEFARPFPAGGPSISDTEREFGRRFRGVGDLAAVIDYAVTHGSDATRANLGVLNTSFELRKSSRREPYWPVDIVPMGADDNVMVGCFDLTHMQSRARRGNRPEQGEIINLLGVAAEIEESTVGYAVLDRRRVSAAGFGIMKYAGRIAVFAEVPTDESLYVFAGDHLNFPADLDLRLARPDKVVQAAKTLDPAVV